MITSPLAPATGWTWSTAQSPELPSQLAGAFPSTASGPPSTASTATRPQVRPEVVVGTQASGTTQLRFPCTGTVSHHHEPATNAHWLWGSPADVGLFPALRPALTLGNPLIVLRFTHTSTANSDDFPSDGVVRGVPVTLGGAGVAVNELTICAAFSSRPGLDTLGVLRFLRAAQNATIASAPSTPLFANLVNEMNGLDQPLRLLDPAGRPLSGRSVTLAGTGLNETVVLDSADRGDVLSAAGIARADLPADATATLAAGTEEITAADPDGGSTTGTIAVSTTTAHLDLASLDSWFGAQGSADLARFTRGNTVRPFINGPEYFDDLFTELHRPPETTPTGTLPVAFYLAGYGINHEANLISTDHGAANRTLTDVVTMLAGAGGEPRFLALQFMQLEPGFVDGLEVAALVAAGLLVAGGIAMLGAVDAKGWDGVNFFGHVAAVGIGSLIGVGEVRDLVTTFEPNRTPIEALHAIAGVEAHLDPYPAQCADNPVCVGGNPIVSLVHAAQNKFGAFHQKIAVVRNDTGIHAYCGGIDLASNRLDDSDHGRRGPYHDVHARVDGPAAGELATTFSQRWDRVATSDLALDVPGALDGLPTNGPDIVQIGRTYFGPEPADPSRGFTFAQTGERTILDTMLAAIGQARRYIYIEDQYLTPPTEFIDALVAAASEVSGPLIIAIPETPDQPFGFAPRQAAIERLAVAWGDRLLVGTLRQRFSRAQTNRKNATGRLWLCKAVADADDTIKLGPPDRIPGTPFWLVVGKEVMRAMRKIPETDDGNGVDVAVERGAITNLFADGVGSSRASHKIGAAVVGGSFPGVYVHAKVMLVDDVFASIGSANSNRRGYYSDGECNLFAMRSELSHGSNWIKRLRMRLWAEALGVTEEFALVAFDDPVRSNHLFGRRFLVGSRFTSVEAQPFSTEFDMQAQVLASASLLDVLKFDAQLLAAEAVFLAGVHSDELFDAIVDPSSHVSAP